MSQTDRFCFLPLAGNKEWRVRSKKQCLQMRKEKVTSGNKMTFRAGERDRSVGGRPWESTGAPSHP